MRYNVKDIFNSPFAVFYEKVINKISSPVQVNRWRKRLIKDILSEIPDPEIVVDYCSGACNMGKLLLSLTSNPPFIINCDISKPLLNLGKEELPEHSAFVCADNRFFPVKNSSIDAVFSSFCVRNSPEPIKTVKEVYRVLKSGGAWGILDFFKIKERAPVTAFNDFLFRSFMKLNGALIPSHREAIEYLFYSIENFYTVDEFSELLRENGFDVKLVRTYMGGVANTLVAIKQEVSDV
ncbi:demethylmenaquinone methyltransferase [Desulfurobacterium pacificum]|uniref:Demethylmenaquinone methyltransferase n=1 Tax=Desulfurobacterium pacificum TaxID=240166 RepID=A0ABY1NBQ6_9BACT|nr:class I SAM-dependent methyltransferase [Desulfurobacterium pacificum]SMP05854.1 demethylmenaquinone methyltransferase [Desulfurobacterium pacificum]